MFQLDFFKKLTQIARPATAAPSPPPATTPVASPPPTTSGRDRALEALGCGLLAAAGVTKLLPPLEVVWNPRMRSTAGMAYPRQNVIRLNPRLREFGDGEVDRTFRHELAHLLAHHRAGRRRIQPHGPEWEKACRDLGLADERRCHTLPLPRRTMTPRHFYRCPSCALELQRVRPLRGKSACLACCKRFNDGRYDDRFRFVKAKTAP